MFGFMVLLLNAIDIINLILFLQSYIYPLLGLTAFLLNIKCYPLSISHEQGKSGLLLSFDPERWTEIVCDFTAPKSTDWVNILVTVRNSSGILISRKTPHTVIAVLKMYWKRFENDASLSVQRREESLYVFVAVVLWRREEESVQTGVFSRDVLRTTEVMDGWAKPQQNSLFNLIFLCLFVSFSHSTSLFLF